jgi:hypothetical protein
MEEVDAGEAGDPAADDGVLMLVPFPHGVEYI